MKLCKKQHDLWTKYQRRKTTKLRNQLIVEYLPLVKKIAYKMSEKLYWKVQPDELESFGVDGLLRAIDAYDLTRGIKFESYASQRIRGSMIDALRKFDFVPRTVRNKNSRIEKCKNRLESEYGEHVEIDEVLDELDINPRDYHKNIHKYHPASLASIDHTSGDSHNKNCDDNDIAQDSNEHLEDLSIKPVDSSLEEHEFWDNIVSLDITDVEKKIIYCYYIKKLTMEETAHHVKLTESGVSQIHKRAIGKIKKHLSKHPDYRARANKKKC